MFFLVLQLVDCIVSVRCHVHDKATRFARVMSGTQVFGEIVGLRFYLSRRRPKNNLSVVGRPPVFVGVDDISCRAN